MQTTSIEWADWTWNPVRGCSRISSGCVNCYAELDMARKNENPKVPGCHGYSDFRIVDGKREAHWTGKVELIESKLLEPLSWRRKALRFAQEHGHKPRVFVNSMSDLFHERLPAEAIDRVFAVMALCPEMDFLCLTKRADRMAEYFSAVPPTWIWLGVSVEDQKRADERIPHLRRTPAAVRFLSVEPMLEEIDITPHIFCVECAEGRTDQTHHRGDPCTRQGINWVICGGESGAHARPFDLAWARSLRDQCKAAGVKYFMKQLGSNPMVSTDLLVYPFARQDIKDKKGGDPAEWPTDLRVQDVPK